uniref:DUF19 domain-containing protein n=1 Tax=Caenorhabditis tropicalis TaxID=1561998 RepID=A0A1I7V2A4_9PELO
MKKSSIKSLFIFLISALVILTVMLCWMGNNIIREEIRRASRMEFACKTKAMTCDNTLKLFGATFPKTQLDNQTEVLITRKTCKNIETCASIMKTCNFKYSKIQERAQIAQDCCSVLEAALFKSLMIHLFGKEGATPLYNYKEPSINQCNWKRLV